MWALCSKDDVLVMEADGKDWVVAFRTEFEALMYRIVQGLKGPDWLRQMSGYRPLHLELEVIEDPVGDGWMLLAANGSELERGSWLEANFAQAKALRIVLWTIYDRPRDYPDFFVLRGGDLVDGKFVHRKECRLFPTSSDAKSALPECACEMPLFGADDPAILVSYLEVS